MPSSHSKIGWQLLVDGIGTENQWTKDWSREFQGGQEDGDGEGAGASSCGGRKRSFKGVGNVDGTGLGSVPLGLDWNNGGMGRMGKKWWERQVLMIQRVIE